MACQGYLEIMDHEDSQDPMDHPVHQELTELWDTKGTRVCKVMMEQKVNKEKLVPQELQVNLVAPEMVDLRGFKGVEEHQDLQDLQGDLVDQVQWDQLEHADLREDVVKQVCKEKEVHLVLKDKMVPQDGQEHPVPKVNEENQDLLVFLDKLENLDEKDHED